jgi:hypothetical protein
MDDDAIGLESLYSRRGNPLCRPCDLGKVILDYVDAACAIG